MDEKWTTWGAFGVALATGVGKFFGARAKRGTADDAIDRFARKLGEMERDLEEVLNKNAQLEAQANRHSGNIKELQMRMQDQEEKMREVVVPKLENIYKRVGELLQHFNKNGW